MSSSLNEDSDYVETTKTVIKTRPRKRIKHSEPVEYHQKFPVEHLLSTLRTRYSNEECDDDFQHFLDPFLDEFCRSRAAQEDALIEVDDEGKRLRPLRPSDIGSFIKKLSIKDDLGPSEAMLLRKIKLERERNHAGLEGTRIEAPDVQLTPIPPPPPNLPIHTEVLDALYSIKTTPYSNSFLARLYGSKEYLPPGLIGVDWETRAPWMNLMSDIHEHYTFAHPEREIPSQEPVPITYSTLHESQLPQIHELLERSFWAGIDVSDSLQYWPERSTVVAMYKKIVVGVAIITSPIQTYITYLAVKAGWDKSQIARTMLYYLINMNPTRDFTLHVSTNSSAMLLYNQFGFKAEGFVAGFYAEYLDNNSRASKNAFMLRLRHI